MRTSRVILVLLVVTAAVLTMAPSQAAKKIENCVLSGSVKLDGPANIFTTASGTGSFVPSSLLQCQGPGVAGKGTAGSSFFYFCQHNVTGSNPACHSKSYNGPTTQLEPVYDTVNTTPAKVIAHAKGSATFVGFPGGVSCSLSFEGHSDGTAAELAISSFTCSNGFKGKGLKKAFALAIPVFTGVSGCPNGPGGAKLCFRNLQFAGIVST
jgi:hypothetical protein